MTPADRLTQLNRLDSPLAVLLELVALNRMLAQLDEGSDPDHGAIMESYQRRKPLAWQAAYAIADLLQEAHRADVVTEEQLRARAHALTVQADRIAATRNRIGVEA